MSQACFLAVLVARASDKFPLCSYADPSFQQQRGPAVANSVCTEQMERVLARFKPASNNQIQSFDFQEFTYYVLPDATAIVVLCVNRQASPFAAAAAAGGGAVESRIQQSACRLLDDILSEFQTMYRPELISSASRKFQFIRFDQQLTKLIRRSTQTLSSAASRGAPPAGGVRPAGSVAPPPLPAQQQPGAAAVGDEGMRSRASGAAADPYAVIRQEVADVRDVMRQNLDDLMTRGERLETMNLYSTELKDSSKNYYQTTKNMNRMRLLKLYGPPVVVISIIAIYIWFFYL
jgi:vesicle transport protein SEC22